jgi:hypothetical protein
LHDKLSEVNVVYPALGHQGVDFFHDLVSQGNFSVGGTDIILGLGRQDHQYGVPYLGQPAFNRVRRFRIAEFKSHGDPEVPFASVV